MIDKIDSNYSYNYGKITKHTTNTGSFEKIRKNYEKNGVVYEKNEQKSGANHPQETLYKAREEEAKVHHAAGLTLEQIKESLRSMIAFLKETWRMIWEDTPKSEDTVGKEQPENEIQMMEETEATQEMTPAEAEVKQVLKTHDLEALNAILTNNGRIKPARNSNLLTTYDKRGRIVSIESSVRERILHGDRNFIRQ